LWGAGDREAYVCQRSQNTLPMTLKPAMMKEKRRGGRTSTWEAGGEGWSKEVWVQFERLVSFAGQPNARPAGVRSEWKWNRELVASQQGGGAVEPVDEEPEEPEKW
jgi:hypothetical protein